MFLLCLWCRLCFGFDCAPCFLSPSVGEYEGVFVSRFIEEFFLRVFPFVFFFSGFFVFLFFLLRVYFVCGCSSKLIQKK